MGISDRILRWFFVNFIKPRLEDIETPGFICTKTEKGRGFLREVILPESFFMNLENRLSSKAHILYTAGKKGSYRYARALNFKNLSENSGEEVKQFTKWFTRYIESEFAKKIDCEMDIDEKTYRMEADDYSICRKNGKGFLFSEGAVAGIVSYVFSDRTIECVHEKCQGRGDKNCVMIAKPQKNIPEARKADVEVPQFSGRYYEINKIVKPSFSPNSLKDLINDMVIDHKDGIISYNQERLVWLEADYLYYLEKLLKEAGLQGVLFDTAFQAGKEIGRGKKNLKFISDFVPALGWGDIYVKKSNEILIEKYPWTRLSEEVDFTTLRGFLSGIASSIKRETINYNIYETSLNRGFSLRIKAT